MNQAPCCGACIMLLSKEDNVGKKLNPTPDFVRQMERMRCPNCQASCGAKVVGERDGVVCDCDCHHVTVNAVVSANLEPFRDEPDYMEYLEHEAFLDELDAHYDNKFLEPEHNLWGGCPVCGMDMCDCHVLRDNLDLNWPSDDYDMGA